MFVDDVLLHVRLAVVAGRLGQRQQVLLGIVRGGRRHVRDAERHGGLVHQRLCVEGHEEGVAQAGHDARHAAAQQAIVEGQQLVVGRRVEILGAHFVLRQLAVVRLCAHEDLHRLPAGTDERRPCCGRLHGTPLQLFQRGGVGHLAHFQHHEAVEGLHGEIARWRAAEVSAHAHPGYLADLRVAAPLRPALQEVAEAADEELLRLVSHAFHEPCGLMHAQLHLLFLVYSDTCESHWL